MEGAAAEGGVGGGGPGGGSIGGGLPPPFLSKTYDMVDDASTDGVVSWSSGNNSFVVWNVAEFSKELLPKYFKHSNFSSFVRQLNTYGFRKVDPDRWEFANEGFLRGKKHLLKTINRRKAPHVNSPAPQIQTAAVGACIEVGKFGLEEEVERLKRDKNLLMQELVRLKQQQQSTDHQLQTVGSRVQMMEQRQQQMMSFLAKAMQSPGFMSQLVQQQNESSRRITNSSKKRRLPNQDEPVFRTYGDRTPDGQVTKFQPLLNEAAASMLRQILNMNVSAQRETSLWKPDAFLIDDVSSSLNAFDSGSSSSRLSGVTLAEVTPSSALSPQLEPSFPAKGMCGGVTEVQSPPHLLAAQLQPSKYPATELLNTGATSILPDLSDHLGLPKNIVGLPGTSIADTGAKMGSVHPMMLAGDGSPTKSNTELSDDDGAKLPGIDDVFWEQFLSTSPLTGETDEMSSVLDDGIAQELDITSGQEALWNRGQHVDQLTEQMGLLTSNATIRR
uniref:HSF-type DNA-binding domain-containing protein n=1 Tax=Kalanchoe fedtschenkoi TaxID=63787 RepID=A0A7N0TCJ4_KALFE